MKRETADCSSFSRLRRVDEASQSDSGRIIKALERDRVSRANFAKVLSVDPLQWCRLFDVFHPRSCSLSLSFSLFFSFFFLLLILSLCQEHDCSEIENDATFSRVRISHRFFTPFLLSGDTLICSLSLPLSLLLPLSSLLLSLHLFLLHLNRSNCCAN